MPRTLLVVMPFVTSSDALAPSSVLLSLVVRPGVPLEASLLRVAMPGAPSSFLFLVVNFTMDNVVPFNYVFLFSLRREFNSLSKNCCTKSECSKSEAKMRKLKYFTSKELPLDDLDLSYSHSR